MNNGKILIIDDDPDVREGIRILLESENFFVTEADNGISGLKVLNEDTDLVILDVMMPGISGLKTCEEIRKISYVPVLFLSAKSKESDKLIGLMAGGDDYLSKPFSYSELFARVKALIRRYQLYKGKTSNNENQRKKIIEQSNIRIRQDLNELFINNQEVNLSHIEYCILLLLMQNPRKVFSAQNLYESIWDEPYFHSCNSTVMVHIRKLRLKIEPDPHNPQYIRTIWGKGYRFEG